MGKAKQFVFRYDGDKDTDEVEEDLDGEIPVPERGSMMMRKGKSWEVVHVVKEQIGMAIPVFRVFLKSKS